MRKVRTRCGWTGFAENGAHGDLRFKKVRLKLGNNSNVSAQVVFIHVVVVAAAAATAAPRFVLLQPTIPIYPELACKLVAKIPPLQNHRDM